MLGLLQQYFHPFAHGLAVTLLLLICSVCSGFVLANLLCVINHFSPKWLQKIWQLYINVVRGTPLLLQLFLIYYGPSQFAWLQHGWWWALLKQPLVCAYLALTNNTIAYSFVLFDGCLQTLTKNTQSAAIALGLKKWQSLLFIEMPYAIKKAIPAYKNEIIMVLKSTSLVSTIAVLDLTGVTNQIIAVTYDNIQWYLFLAGIYLLINYFINGLMNKLVPSTPLA